jgi:hypothetical protein
MGMRINHDIIDVLEALLSELMVDLLFAMPEQPRNALMNQGKEEDDVCLQFKVLSTICVSEHLPDYVYASQLLRG